MCVEAEIVGVHHADEFAPGDGKAFVERSDVPDVLGMTNHSDLWMTSIPFENPAAVVGGGVVNDDDLDRPKRLTQHAVDRGGDEAAVVVARHDEANASLHAASLPIYVGAPEATRRQVKT